MDVREKLVELLSHSPSLDALYGYPSFVESAEWLIANGVTVQKWIPASEPPEEHDSIWAKLYGTKSWQPGLFRKCSYDVLACVEKKDESRRVISIRTYDGKWDHNKLNEETVICWQPMPQPPKGE
jgi:hypothetical protein